MKYNFETKFMKASTDSTAVAKRLILIIEDMEQMESGKPDPAIDVYLHDTPKEYHLPEQPFKGAIVVDDLEDYSKMLQKRVKPDTPKMNIVSRLHEEPADIEDEFVNHCVKQQAAKIKPAKGEKWPHEKFTSDEYPEENKPAESKPKDIDDEEIEIDTVPTDDEPQPEIPHGQKIKSSEIVPQKGTVEDAYLGEHFEITPDEPEEKPLTLAEQELWDYIQKNPQYTMASACRDLNITTSNYYWRKRQLFLKGRKVGGTIPFAKKAED